jgi:nucleotide-binding universal stress UspA family protein
LPAQSVGGTSIDDAFKKILGIIRATMGVDFLIVGTSQRSTLAHLLGGSVVTKVAAELPETIRLVIFG